MRRASAWLAAAALAGCASAATGDRVRPDTDLPAGHEVACDGGFDAAPRLVSGKWPVFPASTLANPDFVDDRKIRHLPLHWEVTARFDVLEDGATANVRSNRTDPAFFATHTNAAIARWRFRPATRGGEPLPAACTYVLTFSIRT